MALSELVRWYGINLNLLTVTLDRGVRSYLEAGILRRWFSWKNYRIKGQRNAKAGLHPHLSKEDETAPGQSSTLSYFLIVCTGNIIALMAFIRDVGIAGVCKFVISVRVWTVKIFDYRLHNLVTIITECVTYMLVQRR